MPAKKTSKNAGKSNPVNTSNRITRTKLRKTAVAKSIIEGKTSSQIAKELSISHRTVNHLKADSETHMMLHDLLVPHREDIEKAVRRTLETIIEDLDAPLISKLGFVVKDADTGQPLPDRQVRSQARNDLINLLARAQPKTADNQTATLTLNQLTLIAENYKQEHLGEKG
jgi:hypothetical protein